MCAFTHIHTHTPLQWDCFEGNAAMSPSPISATEVTLWSSELLTLPAWSLLKLPVEPVIVEASGFSPLSVSWKRHLWFPGRWSCHPPLFWNPLHIYMDLACESSLSSHSFSNLVMSLLSSPQRWAVAQGVVSLHVQPTTHTACQTPASFLNPVPCSFIYLHPQSVLSSQLCCTNF